MVRWLLAASAMCWRDDGAPLSVPIVCWLSSMSKDWSHSPDARKCALSWHCCIAGLAERLKDGMLET